MHKSSIIDVQIGSKYAFVSITLHLTFLEEHCFGKLMKCLKVLPEIKKKKKKILSTNVKDVTGGCFWSEFEYCKIILKKKVNAEIGFATRSRSTTTKAFVLLAKFVIAKYLKQEVDDDLSLCIDEHSPSGPSITADLKIYQCHMIKR